MKIKDGQLFRAKLIKTEADLPKESGTYFAFHKGTKMNVKTALGNVWFISNDKYTIDSWMNAIDWYLQPIEEQESISDKNIEREVQEYLKNTHYPVSKREARILLITFAGMMREHPEQFKIK